MANEPNTVATPSRGQRAFAVAVAAGAISYLFLALSGTIKAENRLNAAEFGVAVVAALAIGVALKPALLDHLQKVDFAGIKLDLGEVKKNQMEVQQSQQKQQAILEDVRLALRLLIGKSEQEHLKNLFKHTTNTYRVKGALRDEIRRLRAMKLIEMCGSKTVGEMPENATFDLAQYVRLTEDGRNFVSRHASEADLQAKGASGTV
jgi:hypothetical protein